MLFDESAVMRTLKQMGLDTSRITPSTLNQAKILETYKLLKELEGLIMSAPESSRSEVTKDSIKAGTDKFYANFPHTTTYPIQNQDILKEKLKLLDSLMDIEVAYRFTKEGGDASVENNYKKLKTEILPLDINTVEYYQIKEYLKNSHSSLHTKYTMELEDVFTIERFGEKERFSPFKKLHNHKLLWHGSRLPNYVGILSQGLRIAPPEAPVTGYFLGKGIYFADISSKSSDYCHASVSDPYGLLMLCDVALGRSYEVAHQKYVTKADLDRAGFHSTKGWGEYAPNSDYDIITETGVVIPLGTESSTGVIGSEIEHNEYIIYDLAQVNLKYLLLVKFNFK